MARFFRRGVTKFVFLPTAAAPATPTRSEITAGTVLKGIAAVSGFSISNSPVPTPDLDSRFTASVPGEDTTDASSLTFWDDNGVTPVAARTTLAKDTIGYLLYMPYGDVPTRRMEVWQVQSTGVNDQIDLSAAGQFQVGLTPLVPPIQNSVVPA